MDFELIVKKVVTTKTETGEDYRVYLANEEGVRVSFPETKEGAKKYEANFPVSVKVSMPQTKLEVEKK